MPGREEALKRARGRGRSLAELQGEFTEKFFPGGEAFTQPIIRLHDAAHQWSNIAPTGRGEAQQGIIDQEGTWQLRNSTGADGFANEAPNPPSWTAGDRNKEFDKYMERHRNVLNRRAKDANKGGNLSFEEKNSPERRFIPEFDKREMGELRKRGREFYGQVEEEWKKTLSPKDWERIEFEGDDSKRVHKFDFSPDGVFQTHIPVNDSAADIHNSGEKIRVRGGYDLEGGLPYGPVMQNMNPPVHKGVDLEEYRKAATEIIKRDLNSQYSARVPGSQGVLRSRTKRQLDSLERSNNDFGFIPKMIYNQKGWEDVKDRFVSGDFIPIERVGSAGMESIQELPKTDGALTAATNAIAHDRVRSAVRTGTARAGAFAGAMPFTDEGTWRLAGEGEYGEAAKRVALETAAGLAASPVVGMGAGVLQRLVPAAAPVVLGVAGALAAATLPTEAVKSASAFLEARTGKGLKARQEQLQDTASGMTASMQAELPRGKYTEGWITVPGKGKRWRSKDGEYSMERPGVVRTAQSQTARQTIPQLFPAARSVPARTPTGVAELKQGKNLNQAERVSREIQNRMGRAKEKFNPGGGEFGITELLGWN